METLHIRTTEPGLCSTCGRELEPDEQRLDATVVWEGEALDVLWCRWCLAEHAPQTLAVLEASQN